jgi:flagellar basal-body rod protein FlgG
MRAEGQNFFSVTDSSGPGLQQTPGDQASGFLRQGFVERSNVSVVDELISLIQAQRNYEVNSRTIQVADEMLQQVSNLI